MLKRTVPWRNKPSLEIITLIDSAIYLRLYLVQENGPTSFVFLDELNSKFKLSIGQNVICSCSPGKYDHCVHTIHALLKIFKVPPENPLLWQASYIDTDIIELTKIRYNQNPKYKVPKTKSFQVSTIVYGSPNLSPKMAVTKSISKHRRYAPVFVNRHQLNPDDLCPICHEQMTEDEGVTYCKVSCGNNFHFRCIIKWAEFKNSLREKVSCPLCRRDLGEDVVENLRQELDEFDNRLAIHRGHQCQGCKNGQKNAMLLTGMTNPFIQAPSTTRVSIKGKLFHCLYCENYELCEKCYLSFEHYEHNKFMVKEDIYAPWVPAKSREKLYLRRNRGTGKNVPFIGYNEEFERVDQHLMLLNTNLANLKDESEKQKSNDLCLERAITSDHYVLSCFPFYTADQEEPAPLSGSMLSLLGRENMNVNTRKMCVLCRRIVENPRNFKRLFCGHLIDEDCLLNLLKNKNFFCPEDNLEILRGFRTAYYPNEARSLAIYNRKIEKSSPSPNVSYRVPINNSSVMASSIGMSPGRSKKDDTSLISILSRRNSNIQPPSLEVSGSKLISEKNSIKDLTGEARRRSVATEIDAMEKSSELKDSEANSAIKRMNVTNTIRKVALQGRTRTNCQKKEKLDALNKTLFDKEADLTLSTYLNMSFNLNASLADKSNINSLIKKKTRPLIDTGLKRKVGLVDMNKNKITDKIKEIFLLGKNSFRPPERDTPDIVHYMRTRGGQKEPWIDCKDDASIKATMHTKAPQNITDEDLQQGS